MPAIVRTFSATGGIAVNTTITAPKTLLVRLPQSTKYAKLKLLSAAARGSVVSSWAVEIAEALIPRLTPLVT